MTTAQNGSAPPYRVLLETALNVRDLGGYPTQSGRKTRRGVFFRSDSLHRISQADQEKLLGLGVHTVIDLRSEFEIQGVSHALASAPNVNYINIPLFTVPTTKSRTDPSMMVPTTLATLYRGMLDAMGDSIRAIFEQMAMVENTPLVFHCTAGKDRTGVVAALLLDLAGVPPVIIADDYARTAEYIRPLISEMLKQVPPMLTREQYEPLLGAEPIYMLDTLAYLTNQHGGSEAYLRSIGLADAKIKQLRALMLDE